MTSAGEKELRRLFLVLTAITLISGATGCAGPWPKMFPVTPLRMAERTGGVERWYDVDGNGRPDYCEIIGPAGRVDRIAYDRDEDGHIDEEIELDRVPAAEVRNLLIILDSVPITMVREFQAQGRLLLFHRATQVLSPFPVMTDPALTEFFGLTPLLAVESAYFDGKRLHDGYDVYAKGGDTPWHANTAYHMHPVMHAFAYLSQPAWYGHELRRINEVFAERSRRGEAMTVGYAVSTSALGSREGRDGHVLALVAVDRLSQQLVYETRGRARLTMMSDHGHCMTPSERIPLADKLAALGYRVGPVLERPGDAVVPEFGVVTCGAIYTHEPARVAGDVVHLRGIELAAYVDRGQGEENIVVLSTDGRARITRSDVGFRYVAELGDPLQIVPLLDTLRKAGKVDANGFVADRVLFEATIDQVYPDAEARLWRAFHGLFVNVPDVYVSVADGFDVGSKLMTQIVHMQATHGSLRPRSTYGFAASMAGEMPPIVRMANLRAAMHAAGVPLEDQ